MNLTTALRLAIAVEILTIFIHISLNTELHPLLQEYQVWEGTRNDYFFIGDNGHWSAMFFLGALFFMHFASSVGLFLGNAWAKSIYITTFIIFNILLLIPHYPVINGYIDYALDSYEVIASGFILALLLFTDVPLDKPTNWFVIIPALFVSATYLMYLFFL